MPERRHPGTSGLEALRAAAAIGTQSLSVPTIAGGVLLAAIVLLPALAYLAFQPPGYGWFFLTMIALAPLLVVSLATFKASMGRVDDSRHHLDQLNRLYMATVETLAMAIDAKDQITHGHIRRVQAYAISLARTLGVNEAREIKAIEAAAEVIDVARRRASLPARHEQAGAGCTPRPIEATGW